eukprot:m.36752 g.36752  ORF g.36752 m.36752 type:complete len:622 (+) comp44824_c0_seq1:407-2272(+)
MSAYFQPALPKSGPPKDTPKDEKGKTFEELADLWVLKFLVDNSLPFAIIESSSFKRMQEMILRAGPAYRVPGSRKITDLLERESALLHETVQKELNEKYETLSVSTDKWTANTTGESYMALTACGLLKPSPEPGSQQLIREHRVLAVHVYEAPSLDAAHVAAAVDKMLSSFHLELTNIVSVTSDTENTMTAANRDFLLRPHLGCVAHLAQLVIKHLENVPQVAALFQRTRALELFCRNTHSAMTNLQQILASDPETAKIRRVKLANSTRWNSQDAALRMLFRYRSTIDRSTIEAALRKYDRETLNKSFEKHFLSEEEWAMIPSILTVISGLVALTNKVQSRDFLACEVTPELYTIKEMLSRDMPAAGILKDLRTNLIEQLQSYERLQHFWMSPTSIGVKAAVFHNRYKTLAFLAEPDRRIPLKKLAREYRKAFPEVQSSTTRPRVLEGFDPFAVTPAERLDAFQEELSKYIRHIPAENIELSVLEYWQIYGPTFPKVFRLAKRYITMLPTSAEAELAFSVSKYLHQDRRCSMTNRRFSTLCFFKFNDPELVHLRETRRQQREEAERSILQARKRRESTTAQKRPHEDSENPSDDEVVCEDHQNPLDSIVSPLLDSRPELLD